VEQLCQQVAVMYASLMKGLEMDQTLMPPYQDKLRASLYTNASEKRRKECLSFCKKEKEKRKEERRHHIGCTSSAMSSSPTKETSCAAKYHHQATPTIDQQENVCVF